jgi:hypothetical protein
MSVFTGNYQQDVKLARQLNLFTGVNPKKVVLEGLIADYLSTVSLTQTRIKAGSGFCTSSNPKAGSYCYSRSIEKTHL